MGSKENMIYRIDIDHPNSNALHVSTSAAGEFDKVINGKDSGRGECVWIEWIVSVGFDEIKERGYACFRGCLGSVVVSFPLKPFCEWDDSTKTDKNVEIAVRIMSTGKELKRLRTAHDCSCNV